MKRFFMFLCIVSLLTINVHAGRNYDSNLKVPSELMDKFFLSESSSMLYYYITDEEKAEVTVFDSYQFPWTTMAMIDSFESAFVGGGRYEMPSEVIYEGKKYTVTAMAEQTVNSTACCAEVQLPEYLAVINGMCLTGSDNLKKIVFGACLKHIGSGSICNLTQLEELCLPASLRSIEPNSCSKLGAKIITLNKELNAIGQNTFNDLYNVESIELPTLLWSLYDSFNNCPMLKTVVIHKLMTPLDQCFNGCPNIEKVIIAPETHFDLRHLQNSFKNIDKTKCTFYVSKDANAVEIAREAGYNVVVDNYPKSENDVVALPADYDTVQVFDLNGRSRRSVEDVEKGEVLIERKGLKVTKVIR